MKLTAFAAPCLLFTLLIVPSESPAGTPSAADITAARASGNVWVNLGTGVYHKARGCYGKTKDGKFMTEDEAKKAGYKAAKRD